MITLHHVGGYSSVDQFGAEILSRVRINAGSTTFQTIKDARDAIKKAKAEMPDCMNEAGCPRFDAERDDGKVWEWL
jgi:hypothetical protein